MPNQEDQVENKKSQPNEDETPAEKTQPDESVIEDELEGTIVKKSKDTEVSTDKSKRKEFSFNVGDTVVVSNRIQEDNRTRVQKFEGIVISKKGSGVSKTFTMRRIGNNSIGVERIFPLYSPNIVDIEVTKQGKARRAKLYYLRERKGRAATYVKPKNKS